MNPLRLPSHQVVSEARVFLKAARLIEQHAYNGNLYKEIPSEHAEVIRQISERLSPGFQLEQRLDDCSKLFVGTRYTYEHGAIRRFDTNVFELAPHLELILAEMTQTAID
ncbi:hypothetical protein [Pseudomonas chlororaphis]|uniref:hypothetical protein n=1 Tax=Pseudomonas chlororaphis TaxID=587753 RepID=UPI0009D7940F|nr:hypothetical protein [Pseudomonas chlororaphis]